MSGALIEGLEVTVRGRLETGRATDRVLVDGKEAPRRSDGQFAHLRRFADAGLHELTIEVMDGRERRLRRTLRVTVQAKPAAKPCSRVGRTALSAAQRAAAKRHGVVPAFENRWGLRFVLIPEGEFLMGSPEEEEGRADDEQQHRVRLTKPFYLQVTEVTNRQYRRIVPDHDSGHYNRKGHKDSVNGENQPVVNVSWVEATEYASNLSRADRQWTYRLPTEAEWEYACRAGTTTRFSWVTTRPKAGATRTRTTHGRRSATESPGTGGRGMTDTAVGAPVASYPPNAWGLYDMHGNVWEWCQDWYGAYPSGRRGSLRTVVRRVARPARGLLALQAGERPVCLPRAPPPRRPDRIVGFRLASSLPPSR